MIERHTRRLPRSPLWRTWLLTVLVLVFGLQLVFLARIITMRFVDPDSSTFERSEIIRLYKAERLAPWRHQWVDGSRISDQLKRAVIVSEDDLFVDHSGVHWNALQKAWERNERAAAMRKGQPARLVGGSTITQQLAKNMFLSGERHFARKAQELWLTWMLEAVLDKRRILEIYLNHVEWGQGIFGAEAAAQHYFAKPSAQLTAWEAARLSVMLPRPKWFEKHPDSPYWSDRTEVILVRMSGAKLP